MAMGLMALGEDLMALGRWGELWRWVRVMSLGCFNCVGERDLGTRCRWIRREEM